MNLLDIICIAILAVASIRCAVRGFIKEIMSVAAVFGGIVAAVFFSKSGAILIDAYIGYSNWNQIAAFLIIFLLIYVVIKLLEGALHRLFDRIHLDRLDRAMGLFLGAIEGAVVVVLIVYLLRVQPVVDFSDVLAASIVADLVLDIVPIFIPAAVESGGTGV